MPEQQTAQSSLQIIQFIEKCDGILHPPFEIFEPYAEIVMEIGALKCVISFQGYLKCSASAILVKRYHFLTTFCSVAMLF